MFINSYPKSVLATNVNPKSDLRNSNGFEIVILRGVISAFKFLNKLTGKKVRFWTCK